ncbi:hypothetical protein J4461_03150 [Candidatus Pacearchaeota archaeon]|nr:hypothetical protein [Candidatus Pacearchaeota archaeon]
MAKKEVFICDNCGKASSELAEGLEIPYQQGWRYLEEFEFKASLNYRHETIRKHFCSNNCLLSFIGLFIKDQEEKLQISQTQNLQNANK